MDKRIASIAEGRLKIDIDKYFHPLWQHFFTSPVDLCVDDLLVVRIPGRFDKENGVYYKTGTPPFSVLQIVRNDEIIYDPDQGIGVTE